MGMCDDLKVLINSRYVATVEFQRISNKSEVMQDFDVS